MINRSNAGWWAIALIVALVVLPPAMKVVVGVIALVAYLISLRLHPHFACRSCGGTGMHPGAVFGYAQRRCGTCGGTPRHRRLGNQILSPGRLTRAEQRAGVAAGRRNRPLP